MFYCIVSINSETNNCCSFSIASPKDYELWKNYRYFVSFFNLLKLSKRNYFQRSRKIRIRCTIIWFDYCRTYAFNNLWILLSYRIFFLSNVHDICCLWLNRGNHLILFFFFFFTAVELFFDNVYIAIKFKTYRKFLC